MTERVDFYILKSSTTKQRLTFACRLAEKAYLRDMRVVLFGESPAEAEALDELLWTFNERSFIPHEIVRAGAARDSNTPVHLAAELSAIDGADLLVNLSAGLPSGLERFARIAEIIDANDERRRLGRERFKAYRDLKLPLETHQLEDTADV